MLLIVDLHPSKKACLFVAESASAKGSALMIVFQSVSVKEIIALTSHFVQLIRTGWTVGAPLVYFLNTHVV